MTQQSVLGGKMRAMLWLACWCAVAPAQAAAPPPVFSVQGVLRDNAGALQTLTADVTVRLYDSPAGLTAFHTQVVPAVEVTNGVFTVEVTGFPLAPFRQGTLVWLALQVAQDAELPRISITPSPYALFCGAADTAGDLDAAARATLQQALVPVTPIQLDSDGRTLRLMSCSDGQVLRFQGNAWACFTPAPTAVDGGVVEYLAGTGLALNPATKTFSVAPNGIGPNELADGAVEVRHLGPLGCLTNEQLLFDGTQWNCIPRPAAGTGLALVPGTNTFSIANGGVDTAQLADNAVTFGKLNSAAVTPTGGNNGSAQVLARSDHAHLAACPAGFGTRDGPGGLTRLCVKNVDSGGNNVDWYEAAQQCFENHDGAQLCTMNQLRIWCTGGNGLNADRWMADRATDDIAFQTNGSNCGNFDGQNVASANIRGMYCCLWFTRQ